MNSENKILTIVGSPKKKGNSYQAAKKLEEMMTSKGDYEFEYIFLKDFNLEECNGCFNCISKGIEYCPIKDDRDMIQKKMSKSDGLVLVSPVYVMTVSGLLKNFIDRMAYLCHRPEYHNKKAMLLTTTGGMGIKETLKYMELAVGAWGYDVASECGLVNAPWPPTVTLKNKNSNILEKSAQKFDSSLKSAKQGVSFKNYMGFKIFQTISENVKDYIPADYVFYKDKEYYYPTKIGIFNKIAARIVLPVIFFMMRDLGPGAHKRE